MARQIAGAVARRIVNIRRTAKTVTLTNTWDLLNLARKWMYLPLGYESLRQHGATRQPVTKR